MHTYTSLSTEMNILVAITTKLLTSTDITSIY